MERRARGHNIKPTPWACDESDHRAGSGRAGQLLSFATEGSRRWSKTIGVVFNTGIPKRFTPVFRGRLSEGTTPTVEEVEPVGGGGVEVQDLLDVHRVGALRRALGGTAFAALLQPSLPPTPAPGTMIWSPDPGFCVEGCSSVQSEWES